MAENGTGVQAIYFCDQCLKMIRPAGTAGTVQGEKHLCCPACVAAASAPATPKKSPADSSQRLKARPSVPLVQTVMRLPFSRRQWALVIGGATVGVCAIVGVVLYAALSGKRPEPQRAKGPEAPFVPISIVVTPGANDTRAGAAPLPSGNDVASPPAGNASLFPTEPKTPVANVPAGPKEAAGNLPLPVKLPTIAEALAAARKEVEAKLLAAQTYAKEHPDALPEALKMLKAAEAAGMEKLAGDDPVLVRIGDELKAVNQRLQEQTQKAWEDLKQKARETAQRGDYDAALSALEKRPEPLDKPFAEQAAAEMAGLQKEADARFKEACEAGEKALAQGDTEGGLKALEKLAPLNYAPWRQRVLACRAGLETARMHNQQKTAQERLKKAREVLYTALEQSGAAGGVAGLREAVKQAQEGPDAAVLKGDLDALQAVAEGLVARAAAAREYVTGRKGQELSLQTSKGIHKGTVSAITDDTIALEVQYSIGGVAQKPRRDEVPWSTLLPAQMDLLTKSWKPAPATLPLVLRGLEVLGDPAQQKNAKALDEAAGALAGVKDSPVAAWLLARVHQRQSQLLEQAAIDAWKRIETGLRNLDPARARAAVPQVQQYLAQYGLTEFAKKEVAPKLRDIKRACFTNYVKNGGFETGNLDGWKTNTPRDLAVAKEDGAPEGKFALQVKGKEPVMTQEVKLEAGKAYVLSCWAKVPEAGGGLNVWYGDTGNKNGTHCGISGKDKWGWAREGVTFHASPAKPVVTVQGKDCNIWLDAVAVTPVDEIAPYVLEVFARAKADVLPRPDGRVILGVGMAPLFRVHEGWESLSNGPDGLPGFDGTTRIEAVASQPLAKVRQLTFTFIYTATAPVKVEVHSRKSKWNEAAKTKEEWDKAELVLPAGKLAVMTCTLGDKAAKDPHDKAAKDPHDFECVHMGFWSNGPGTLWLYRVIVKE